MNALVVGSLGQDGRLITKLLESRGYSVTGLDIGLGPSILDPEQVSGLIRELQIREIYYLAAHHHSSEDKTIQAPDLLEKSRAVNVQGLTHFLESIRVFSPRSRLFYASSSHVLGGAHSAYALTKLEGMGACAKYRNEHGVFASTGILYNHESPLRAENFLSKKIVRAAVRIKKGEQKELVLGNLAAQADWGYAPDFVEAMHLILQAPRPDDFVIATGRLHSVEDFVRITFEILDLDWKRYVREDSKLLTRTERPERPQAGDISKITRELGWKPKTDFETMIRNLVESELA